MIAGQTLVAQDGYEVALFPMDVLYMTQDEGGDYSHEGTYNIDLVGRHAVYPIYAPCTMRVVGVHLTPAGGNNVQFQSVDKVHLANGQLDYLTIEFSHDANPPITIVGQVVQQGQLCYHTGSYGYVTGDHVHTCAGEGPFAGSVSRPPNGWYDLANRIHYWDAVYVNDTEIIQGFGHDWKIWDGPTPTVRKSKKGFPWPVAWKNWDQFKLR